ADGDVMDATTTYLEKLGNWRIWRHWLEQFKTRLSNWQHANAHLLSRNFFGVVCLQSEQIVPDLHGSPDFSSCNSDVMNLHKKDVRGRTSDIRLQTTMPLPFAI